MKLSIIVPIYGVEAYLDFCLKSIAQQGVEGMEVILVDDASPDGCGDICDRWAEADGRFRVAASDNTVEFDYRTAEVLSGDRGEDTILDAFCWVYAPEGQGFWQDRNEEFREWYFSENDNKEG